MIIDNADSLPLPEALQMAWRSARSRDLPSAVFFEVEERQVMDELTKRFPKTLMMDEMLCLFIEVADTFTNGVKCLRKPSHGKQSNDAKNVADAELPDLLKLLQTPTIQAQEAANALWKSAKRVMVQGS